MKAVAVLLVFCLAVFDLSESVCTPYPPPAAAVVDAETTTPDWIVTFDGKTKVVGQDSTVFSSQAATPFVVTLMDIGGSTGCTISNSISFGGYSWSGASNWYGENTKPGDFVVVTTPSGGGCSFIFSESVSYFSMRVAAAADVTAGITVTDPNGDFVNCDVIPYPANQNGYAVRGFHSPSKNIRVITFAEGTMAIDLLKINRCGPDTFDNGIDCQYPCDMIPCGANANCTNYANRTGDCRCFDYYAGNSAIGCEKWSCANSAGYCSADATCADVTTEPYISCTCNDGFSGTGVGPNGCSAGPMAPVASSPSTPMSDSSPSSSSPGSTTAPQGTTPTSSPVKKVSASSLIAPLLWLTLCSWIIG